MIIPLMMQNHASINVSDPQRLLNMEQKRKEKTTIYQRILKTIQNHALKMRMCQILRGC